MISERNPRFWFACSSVNLTMALWSATSFQADVSSRAWRTYSPPLLSADFAPTQGNSVRSIKEISSLSLTGPRRSGLLSGGYSKLTSARIGTMNQERLSRYLVAMMRETGRYFYAAGQFFLGEWPDFSRSISVRDQDIAGAGGAGVSGSGMNSSLSASGNFIRPAFQSSAAWARRSFDDETKFQ